MPRVRGKAKAYSEAFEACWSEYGRKEEKGNAYAHWRIQARRFGGEENLRVLVLGSLKWQAPIWAVDGWKFATYFERYLKRTKWEDVPPPPHRNGARVRQDQVISGVGEWMRAQEEKANGPR